jgi:hypothetical protein
MANLKTIEEKVRAVLKANEEARDDDMKLYLNVCNDCVPNAGNLPLEVIMIRHKSLGIPRFESVRRTRQKLQAENPELSGSTRMIKLRQAQEQVYRNYAKE